MVFNKQKGKVGSATELDNTSISTILADGEAAFNHNTKEITVGSKNGNINVVDKGYLTTALNGKADTSHTHTLANISDMPSGISATELSYLDNVSSSIQTQLDGKQATLVSGTNIKTVNGEAVIGAGNLIVTSIPDMASHSGQYLTNNGTTANWAAIAGVSGPVVGTLDVSSISSTTMTANGQITDFSGIDNTTTQVRFSYGTDASASNVGQTSWVSKSDLTPFSTSITGLTADTIYKVKAQMRDTNRPAVGTIDGDIVTASTLVVPPETLDANTFLHVEGASSGAGVVALNSDTVRNITSGSISSNKVVHNASGKSNTAPVVQDAEDVRWDTTSGIVSPAWTSLTDNLISVDGKMMMISDARREHTVTAASKATVLLRGHEHKYALQAVAKDLGVSGNWTTGNLPAALIRSQAFCDGTYVYLLGGDNGAAVSTVYKATLGNDLSVSGNWSTGALPGGLRYSQAFCDGTYVYLLGGDSTSIVYKATLGTDLSVSGNWSTGALPVVLGATQVFCDGTYVYLLGGQTGSTYISTVYKATLGVDLSVSGSWSSGSLPAVLGYSQAFCDGTYVYLLGGQNASTAVATVYKATLGTDLSVSGNWSTGALPETIRDTQVFCDGTYVYLLGRVHSVQAPTVYKATLGTDLSVSTNWVTGALPGALAYSQVFCDGNNVYLLGGHNGSATTSTVYKSSLNTTTTWADIGRKQYKYTTTLSPALTTNPTDPYVCTETDFIKAVPVAKIEPNKIVWDSTSGIVSPAFESAVNNLLVIGDDLYIDNGAVHDITAVTKTTGALFRTGHEHKYALQAVAKDLSVSGNWTTGALPAVLGRSQVFCDGTNVYLLGGERSGGVAIVYKATLGSDLSVSGNWSTGSLPSVARWAQVFCDGTYVYLLGGNDSPNALKATLGADLSVSGNWTTGSIPAVLSMSQVFCDGTYVYLLGGVSTSTVYKATLGSDLSVSTNWSTGSLPAHLSASQVFCDGAYVYLISGSSSTIYKATLGTDLSVSTNWATGSLPAQLSQAQVFCDSTYVYLLGGHLNVVYKATLGNDLSVSGNWSSGSLPAALIDSQVFCDGNNVYLLGSASSASVYKSALNTTTTWANIGLRKHKYTTTLSPALASNPTFAAKAGQSISIFQSASDNAGVKLKVDTTSTASIPVFTHIQDNLFAIGDDLTCDGVTAECTTLTKATALFRTGHEHKYALQAVAKDLSVSGNWSSGSIPAAAQSSQVFCDGTYVYLMGGYNGSAYISTVYKATLGSDLSVSGNWSSGALPAVLCDSQVFCDGTYVYLLGGNSSSGIVATVYKATLGSNLAASGSWSTGSLPAALCASQVFCDGTYVYLLSGSVNVVYKATLGTDLSVSGNWSSGSLPAAVAVSQVFCDGVYVYLISGGGTSAVRKATLGADLSVSGNWSTGALPVVLSHSQVFCDGAYVYMLGGASLATVLKATLGADLSVSGNWSSGSLPAAFSNSQVFCDGNNIYLLGGSDGSTTVATVYKSALNTPTTWANIGRRKYKYTTTLSPALTTNPTNVFIGEKLSATPATRSRSGDVITVTCSDVVLIGARSVSQEVSCNASDKVVSFGTTDLYV